MKTIKIKKEARQQIAMASEAATYLWKREWAESNGGNISINLTEHISDVDEKTEGFPFIKNKNIPSTAKGMSLFVTGTGKRMRDLREPGDSACIIQIAKGGYYIIWGGGNDENFRPTSELLPHLHIHMDLVAHKSPCRTVVHTHPMELICLSHHPQISHDHKRFNKILWSMLPEIRMFMPRGLGVLEFILGGSQELAEKTAQMLRKHDVVLWNKHGALAAGTDALNAFDLIDVANKGAKIYLQCLASGFTPEGLSDDELAQIATLI